jgi:hypothetical protein
MAPDDPLYRGKTDAVPLEFVDSGKPLEGGK